jgi:hypothetical protein
LRDSWCFVQKTIWYPKISQSPPLVRAFDTNAEEIVLSPQARNVNSGGK